VNSRQDVVTSGAVTGDILAQLRVGKLYIRQLPGAKNSLGLVKFIFPNSSNVYMHDTPAQEFFAKSRRDFSHGCIRLEKPADLAVWVLRENPGWDLDRVHATMNGTPNQQVNLANPIPVLILYGTVIVTEDGIVHFLRRHLWARRCARKSSCQGLPVPWLIAGDEIRRTVETPLPNAADVQVDEVRVRIVAHTAASQAESSLTAV